MFDLEGWGEDEKDAENKFRVPIRTMFSFSVHRMETTEHMKIKNKWLAGNMFMCTQWIQTILSVNILPFNVNVGGSNIPHSHQGSGHTS